MKQAKSVNIIIYTTIFILYFLFRINYIMLSVGLSEIDFKILSISNIPSPFEIIKQTALNTIFLPAYNLLVHIILIFSKNEYLIRLFNAILSFINIIVFIQIGKSLFKSKKAIYFAAFIGIFLSISHFFLYYTNLIAPYSLNLLIESIVVNFLINYLKKPDDKNLKKLTIANILCILCDSLGYIFIISQLIILFLTSKKKRNLNTLFIHSFIAFLVIFPIIITQYIIQSKLLIPNAVNGVGINFNSFYLALNDLISPYLSFEAPENQTKSTLGMLYAYFLNTGLSTISSFKIILTLLFGSFLPILISVILTMTAYKKNPIIKIITQIALFYSIIILFGIILIKSEITPTYFLAAFICFLISSIYGLFTIKDNFIKGVLIFCILAIQFINPEITTFNLTIKKNYPTIGCINTFIRDYNVNKNDFIIMPYLGKYAKFYYKKLNFMDLDYEMLLKKNSLTKNLVTKNAKTINKNNIHFLMQAYLYEKYPNQYITQYFIENYDKLGQDAQRIILIADKNNSKLTSLQSIIKCVNNTQYNPKIKKINLKNPNLLQNQAKTLYDSLKSKTFYNLTDILTRNFYLQEIAEYKKIDNEYYKIKTNAKNIYDAINSTDSDYVFIIFKIL